VPVCRSTVVRRLLVLLTPLLLVAGLTVGMAPAGRAADAAPPTGLTPSGASVSGIPTLSWTRIAAANDRYDVQVATDSTFATRVVDTNTRNSSYVPTRVLPSGTTDTILWWRVRLSGSSDTSWAARSFVLTPPTAPALKTPVNNAQLAQPQSPPLLSWDDVPRAVRYTAQISTDPNFADTAQISSWSTDGATSVVPDLQKPGTYYWRVQGDFGGGIVTPWSAIRRYTSLGLTAPTLVGPPDDSNNAITDVVLDWDPVLGAAAYDIQISNDSNFPGNNRYASNDLTSTKFSPPATLDNDQYYWRVRPVDAAGNRLEWTAVATWKFQRSWTDQSRLVHPANAAVVGDPFYFQWTPIPHASRYEVQVAPTAAGLDDERVRRTCSTVHTTLTLGDFGGAGNCFPTALGGLYWRVIGYDEFSNDVPVTESIDAEIRRFTYNPATVIPATGQEVTPTTGSTVTVPTIHWRPTAGASRYGITITDTRTGATLTDNTAATSFTPVNLADGTYRWDVRAISEDGRTGPGLLPASQPSFTLDAANSTDPVGSQPDPEVIPDGHRFPTLRWSRMAGADRYRVYTRHLGDIAFSEMPGTWTFNAADDRRGEAGAPGDYEFYVEAYTGNKVIGTGKVGRFTISQLPAVADGSYAAALSGNAVTGNGTTRVDTCNATLPASCQNLRQTPVLSWENPDPDVGYYKLVISKDAALTNIVRTYDVSSTMFIDNDALQDGQAGSAYFWELLPCTTGRLCSVPFRARHSFNKLGRPVTLTAPRNGAEIKDEVTLSWDDYLTTLARPDSASDPDSLTPLDTPAATEARSYRVEIAGDPAFQSTYTTVDVDQTTFTLFNNTLPEGPSYWRVAASDGSGNPLQFSETRMFQKSSPSPVEALPDPGSTVRGDQPLSWAPLAWARSYDVEIYANNDTVPSPANRIVAINTRQSVLTLGRPLAVSDKAYTWRIARRDARERVGAWSELRSFIVAGSGPSLLAPAEGASKVSPVDSSFTWSQVPNAAYYRWELRPGSGNSGSSVNITTPATSWAPTDALAGGSWTWRVVALDSAQRDLGPSLSGSFTVVDSVLAQIGTQISGNPQVGNQLTVTTGTPKWNTDVVGPVTTTFQWKRGGNDIQGATTAAYVLTSSDVAQDISVVATGTATGYKTGTSTSSAIRATSGAAIAPTTPPRISGAGRVGSELTANPGTWPGNPSFTYQWVRDSAVIGGATGQRYALSAFDGNHQVSVRVTATTSGYDPGTASSPPLAIGQLVLSPTAPPTISGTPRSGSVLTASPGAWPGSPTFSYQWLRSGLAIPGATSSTYQLTAADAGQALVVRVVARASGFEDGTKDSDPVTVARNGLAPVAAPSISGSAIVRGVITADPGTWPGSPTFTYSWTRDGVSISGADRREYTILPVDAGHLLAVQVLATASGYEPASATSGAVKVAKQTSATAIALDSRKLSSKARAKATVTVKVNGVVDPAGTVRILDGSRVVATAALKPGGTGQVVVRLPKLKKGKHVLRADYAGTESAAESASGSVKVKVVAKKRKR
jgi:hypothetical protein